eukprot:2128481-Amphidinium_carterae.1
MELCRRPSLEDWMNQSILELGEKGGTWMPSCGAQLWVAYALCVWYPTRHEFEKSARTASGGSRGHADSPRTPACVCCDALGPLKLAALAIRAFQQFFRPSLVRDQWAVARCYRSRNVNAWSSEQFKQQRTCRVQLAIMFDFALWVMSSSLIARLGGMVAVNRLLLWELGT